MPAWTVLTPDSLLPYLAAKPLSALRTKALAADQPDPVEAILADITTRVRAEVRGHRPNRVSATAHAVPPELESATIALAVEAATRRLPGLPLSAEQRRAAEEARALLVRVARGEVPVSRPDDPEEPDSAQRTGSVETLASRTNPLTGKRLRHL